MPPTAVEDTVPQNELATQEQINAQMLAEADKAFQENIDQREIRMSRLSICQGTTKEIAMQVEGYSLGQIISSGSRQVLSKKGPPPWLKGKTAPGQNVAPCHYLAVIPVMKLPTEYVEWVPKTEQKEGEPAIRFKSLNQNDERVKAGTYKTQGGSFDPGPNNNAPPITTGINYLFLPFDEETKQIKEGFIIGTFARTSAPTGSQLTTLITNMRTQKKYAWDCVYYLYTAPKPTKKGTTQIYQVAFGGLTKEICPEHYSMALQMAITLSTAEGKQLQELMLNAADLTTDHDEDYKAGMPSDTLDAQLQGAGTAEADAAFGDGSAKQGF